MDYNTRIDEAFELFEVGDMTEAIKVIQEVGSDILPTDEMYADYLLSAAYIFSADNHFDKARALLNQLLETNDKENQIAAYHQLGLIERMDAEFEAAANYFNQEQALIDKDDAVRRSVNLYELGYVQLLNNQYEEGLASLQHSLQLAETAQDDISIACSNRALGELYAAQEDMTQAKAYFNEAKSYFRKAEDEFGVEEIEALEAAIY